MPEPVSQVQTDAGGVPIAPTEAPFELSKYVENDGKLKETFNEIVPEDMRHLQVWKKATTFKDLVRQTGELDRMIGKKGVIIPDPKTATPSDIDSFHRAMGRPDTPDGYTIKLPDELKDFYTPESIRDFQAFAFKQGMNPQVVQNLMDYKAAMDMAEIKAEEEYKQQRYNEANDALHMKWGAAYETRLHMANYMIENFTESPEQKAELLAIVGNNPQVAEYLSGIAGKFIESGTIRDVDIATGAITPKEAESKMKELIAEHQQHAKWKWDNPAGYKREEDEIDRLAKIAAS